MDDCVVQVPNCFRLVYFLLSKTMRQLYLKHSFDNQAPWGKYLGELHILLVLISSHLFLYFFIVYLCFEGNLA